LEFHASGIADWGNLDGILMQFSSDKNEKVTTG
jgi:hypothetical protein